MSLDARLQRRVQRYGWDKAASAYEAGWRDQLAPAQSTMLDSVAWQAGQAVLDIACGTGLVTMQAAARVGPTGTVCGTDISERMVALAQAAAEAQGVTNTCFIRMDAEDLQFEAGTFDLVLCALGLMYLPDPEAALREIHRVLRPGGQAAVAVWGQRSRCGWAEIFPIVDARVQSEVCPMFFRLGTGDALSSAFAQACFGDAVSVRIDAPLRYACADDACEASFVGGPVALAYDRFDDQTRRAVRDEYLASIEPFRDGNGYAIPGEFVITAGRKPTGAAAANADSR
jgi:ubiquinone/menaquinone biosynthesis C-methylase UbiE